MNGFTKKKFCHRKNQFDSVMEHGIHRLTFNWWMQINKGREKGGKRESEEQRKEVDKR